jgi:predicted Zn-dependent peptidase
MQGSDTDIQADWFGRAKKMIPTSQALENETPDAQASLAAIDELYGLGYNFNDHFAADINAVTLDQIRQCAATRLQSCIVTICTPNPELVTIKPGDISYDSFPTVDLTPRGVQHAQPK